MNFVVEAENLTKVYAKNNVVANNGIDLTINEGEIFGLLGPNGAGKTTFVRQVVGLVQPTSGSIKVLGWDMAKQPEKVLAEVNYMSQNIFAIWHLKVREVIEYSAMMRGLSKGDARLKCNEILADLGMEEFAGKMVRQLSGGLRQLTGFGAAFVGTPRLLVLDEPTSALDVARRRKLWDKVKELNQQQGVTVVLVTHSVVEAEHVLDRLAIIRDGRLEALGSPGELKAQVDDRLRLEIIPKNGGLPQAMITELGNIGEVFSLRGRIIVLSPRGELQQAVGVVERYGFEGVDDFKIGTANLEDVYMKLGGDILGTA